MKWLFTIAQGNNKRIVRKAYNDSACTQTSYGKTNKVQHVLLAGHHKAKLKQKH